MYIRVRVKTEMKKESMRKRSDTHFELSVKEKPLQNLANKRVIERIAAHFGVPIGKVRIVSGHHSPSKILSVEL